MILTFIILFILALIKNSNDGSGGVPDGVNLPSCKNVQVIPADNTDKSQVPFPPYTMKMEPNTVIVSVLGSIKLTLTAKDNGYFKRVQIEARNFLGMNVGKFKNPSDDIKVVNCDEGTNNAVIQVDDEKKTEITVTWTSSPDDILIPFFPVIYFIYTIVQDLKGVDGATENIFWAKIVTVTSGAL